jgi:hypothetical protein
MTLTEFRATLGVATPPPGLVPALTALWLDGRGEWDRAHRVAQDVDSPDGAWVHAYLHRKEGDPGNADYWYRRAGRPTFDGTLDEEWALIAASLLERG